MGVAEQEITDCGSLTFVDHLSPRSLRLYLTSDSDLGTYKHDAGWTCDSNEGLHFDAIYRDANRDEWASMSGTVKMTYFDATRIEGTYDVRFAAPAGGETRLAGSFRAPDCAP